MPIVKRRTKNTSLNKKSSCSFFKIIQLNLKKIQNKPFSFIRLFPTKIQAPNYQISEQFTFKLFLKFGIEFPRCDFAPNIATRFERTFVEGKTRDPSENDALGRTIGYAVPSRQNVVDRCEHRSTWKSRQRWLIQRTWHFSFPITFFFIFPFSLQKPQHRDPRGTMSILNCNYSVRKSTKLSLSTQWVMEKWCLKIKLWRHFRIDLELIIDLEIRFAEFFVQVCLNKKIIKIHEFCLENGTYKFQFFRIQTFFT